MFIACDSQLVALRRSAMCLPRKRYRVTAEGEDRRRTSSTVLRFGLFFWRGRLCRRASAPDSMRVVVDGEFRFET